MTYFAHTLEGRPPEDWEPLEDHLREVAEVAGDFAAAFGAKEWGYLAGLWHDLGKYLPEFQAKLHGEKLQVEHAAAGAALTAELLRKHGPGAMALAAVIAGHHGGIPDKSEEPEGKTPLSERLKNGKKHLDKIRLLIAPEVLQYHEPETLCWMPALMASKPDNCPHEALSLSFFTRMLFSALVDADSLMTENFCQPDNELQHLRFDELSTLRDRLDAALDEMTRKAGGNAVVNAKRANILQWCRSAADHRPGFFSLNVPTGGGKTLSGLSFALNHAVKKNLRRVIVAVPYLTITQQTSEVYARHLGAENVLEHHSNLDDSADLEERKPEAIRRQLATENWASPVIVTTSVQLCESLLSNKRSRSRKLHHIARSVIILDEAQCLPNGCLAPVMHVLKELVEHYGCTVVLCTATQPALHYRESFKEGIQNIQPIIPTESELELHGALKRVEIDWSMAREPLPLVNLAEKIVLHPCVLTIVHRKADARELYRLFKTHSPDERVFHLSTNMCPAHRRKVLRRIRAALSDWRKRSTPVRVVSTQLIEAGVDLDFPVVFRALAGLDSIAQAAGRCNREGKLEGLGQFFVFRSESPPPPDLRHAFDESCIVLQQTDYRLDLSDPKIFTRFFAEVYQKLDRDQNAVMPLLKTLSWDTAARRFHMIRDEGQVPLIVPYDAEGRRRLEKAQKHLSLGLPLNRTHFRSLQAYTISVFQSAAKKVQDALSPLYPESEARVLDLTLYPQFYDDHFGLSADEDDRASVRALIQ